MAVLDLDQIAGAIIRQGVAEQLIQQYAIMDDFCWYNYVIQRSFLL